MYRGDIECGACEYTFGGNEHALAIGPGRTIGHQISVLQPVQWSSAHR